MCAQVVDAVLDFHLGWDSACWEPKQDVIRPRILFEPLCAPLQGQSVLVGIGELLQAFN